jgi:hypothetical protein
LRPEVEPLGPRVLPAASTLQFIAPTFFAREDAPSGKGSLTVARTGDTTTAVSVHYATEDFTARAGTDYTATTGTLNFAAGQTSATISVPLRHNTFNGLRTLAVQLSAPTGGATLGTESLADLSLAAGPRTSDDFDGDGTADPGVFGPSSAGWVIDGSWFGKLQYTFGDKNLRDIPVPGDYENTGETQPAIFRQSTAQWIVFNPTTGKGEPVPFLNNGQYGLPNLFDIPVPGDYFHLGYTQVAVFRPSTAQWFVYNQATGYNGPVPVHNGVFGDTNLRDIPVPGDYLHLGYTQMAIYRPATSEWWVYDPRVGHGVLVPTHNGKFGAPNLSDIPAPGDYLGLGFTQMAVFRPSLGQFLVWNPNTNQTVTFTNFTAAKDLSQLPVEAPIAALKALHKIPGLSGTSAFAVPAASAATAPADPGGASAPATSAAVFVPLGTAPQKKAAPQDLQAAWAAAIEALGRGDG